MHKTNWNQGDSAPFDTHVTKSGRALPSLWPVCQVVSEVVDVFTDTSGRFSHQSSGWIMLNALEKSTN